MTRHLTPAFLAILALFDAAAPEVSAEDAAPAATSDLSVKKGPWIVPSVRTEQLTIWFRAANPTDKSRDLTARTTITDVRTNQAAAAPNLQKFALPAHFSGDTTFVVPAKGLKTWSHWDPQLYDLDVVIETPGQAAIQLPRARFGYREAWTDKGRFYVNGKKVFLFGGNHSGRRNDREMKFGKAAKFNADTIRDELDKNVKTMELSDQRGHYLIYSYVWWNPDDRATLMDVMYQHGNHPSLIGWALDENDCMPGPHGHPMQIGAVIPPEQQAKEAPYQNVRMYNEADPGRWYGYYVRGLGGNYRSLMWDLGWGVPVQSQEEWMSFWGKNRDQVEPFFPQEFAFVRLGANMVRMDRQFGQSAIVEHMARYLGDESYRKFDESMVASYTSGVKRPQNEPNSRFFYLVKDYMYARILPPWRVYGFGGALLHVDGHPEVLVTKDNQQSPLGETFARVASEIYFYLGGPKEDFVSKDHGFFPGEKMLKSGILINDSPGDIRGKVEWEITRADGKRLDRGRDSITVKQGEVGFLPIRFKAPKVTEKTSCRISASYADSSGAVHKAAPVDVRVYPKSAFAWKGPPVLLIDSTGETRQVLGRMGVTARPLTAEGQASGENAAALDGGGLLVIGRNSYPEAVKVLAGTPVQEAVRRGLHVVVLEQMNRYVMGLKIESTGSRDVFVRAKDSPLLRGLDNGDLANWRGESRMLPSYPSFDPESLWWWQSFCYQGQMNTWRQRRAWHWSNKATVATFSFEKPQFGNFRVLLDDGFDLLYTPLVEFQMGKGRILLNQLDLIDHYGTDPAAGMLLERILAEYAAAPIRALAPVGVLSDSADAAMKTFHMTTSRGLNGSVAFLLPEDLDGMASAGAEALRRFIEAGGTVLVSVKTAEQAAKLPVRVTLEPRKVFNPDLPDDPAFSGLGVGDVFLREMQEFLSVTKIEGVPGKVASSGLAAVAQVGKGRVVFLQVPPDKRKGAEEFWSRSKVIRLYAALLSNLGGQSDVELDPTLIGGWGIANEWLPGYSDRVPKKAPKVKSSPLYEQPALDWDPDAHVAF